MHPDCPRRLCSSSPRVASPWSIRSGASPTWWWRPLPQPKLRGVFAWYPSAATRQSMRFPVPENRECRTKIDLAYKEFELLKYLVQHPGRVFTRAQLLQEVWGYDYYGGTRTVDVHIRRLRAKLGGEYEHVIGTVRNVGYRFDPPEEEEGDAAAKPTTLRVKTDCRTIRIAGIACDLRCLRLPRYLRSDCRLSHFRTRDCIFIRR